MTAERDERGKPTGASFGINSLPDVDVQRRSGTSGEKGMRGKPEVYAHHGFWWVAVNEGRHAARILGPFESRKTAWIESERLGRKSREGAGGAAAADAAAGTSAPPGGRSRMARLLLVEDNEENRRMLTKRLVRRGYEILHAEDGLKAVRMARESAPDLILMDLSLPLLDGWKATAAIRSEEAEGSRVPIIALTAHALVPDRQKALEAGCDDYDTKPVDLPRLLLKIEKLLGAEAK